MKSMETAGLADTLWQGDARFYVPAPKVVYKCYQDPISATKTKVRFLTHARERYMRSDISAVLYGSLAGTGSGVGGNDHVLIPDAAFARAYIEFIEGTDVELLLLGSTLDEMRHGARSNREYKRLRGCSSKPTRSISVFYNQFFTPTEVVRRRGQCKGDHDTDVWCTAAAWLSGQSFMVDRCCVLVSDDEATLNRAPIMGVNVLTSQAYFGQYWATSFTVQTLVESVHLALETRRLEEAQQAAAFGGDRRTRQRRWMRDDELALALQAGTVLRGQLQVDDNRPEEAWIRVSKDSSRPDAVDLFLPTREHRGRSIHGDTVAVLPLARDEWGQPSFQLRRQSATEEGAEKSAGTKQQDLLTAEGQVPTGRVVGVLETADRSCVATIEDDVTHLREGATAALLAIPMDLRLPKLRLRTRRGAALAQCRLVLAIDDWCLDSTYPSAHLVRVLGPCGDVDVESEAILVECELSSSHKVPYDAPSLKPLWDHLPRPISNAREFAFEFGPADMEGRRDLRHSHTVMSIDPPGCVDIDDALSLRQLPNNRLELGVHIADVSHYVAQGSALDREARARSTTVYMVDRRLDMLPALLSTNLCSLRGGEDRCAMSVMWEFEMVENVGWVAVNTWFGRTLINSVWEGSYQVAQAIIDGSTSGKHAAEAKRVFGRLPGGLQAARNTLQSMLRLAMDLRRQRALRGALELHSSEVDFDLVRPTGTVDVNNPNGKAEQKEGTHQQRQSVEAKSVMPHESLPVMDMVAELMILANMAVAEKIYTAFPAASCLRRHPLPRSERFDELVKTAALQGLTLDPSSNAALAASLAEAERSAPPAVAVLLKAMATRAMTEAEYFCTGDFPSPEDFYHYGLAAEFYTHFTSPIRRFADVVVHRLLVASLEQERKQQQRQQQQQQGGGVRGEISTLEPTLSAAVVSSLSDQCRHMNERHRMAKAASERSQELFFSVYFGGTGRTVCEAVISSVRANGVVVYVPQYEVHGSVYLRAKDGSAFMPLGDGSEGDAAADPKTTLEFETGGKPSSTVSGPAAGQGKRLIARAHPGGQHKWAIKVFDRIVVAITAEQSKFHLPGLKIAFVDVGSFPKGHSSGKNDTKLSGSTSAVTAKSGKATMGSLRAAILEEQAAKEARMNEITRAALEDSRRKAGLLGKQPASLRGSGSIQKRSLYERLRISQSTKGVWLSSTTSTSKLKAGNSDRTNSVELGNRTADTLTTRHVANGAPARRKIGGGQTKSPVTTLREQAELQDCSGYRGVQHHGGDGHSGNEDHSVLINAQTVAGKEPNPVQLLQSPQSARLQPHSFPELGEASIAREAVHVNLPAPSSFSTTETTGGHFSTTAFERAAYCVRAKSASSGTRTQSTVGYHSHVAAGPKRGQGFSIRRTIVHSASWRQQATATIAAHEVGPGSLCAEEQLLWSCTACTMEHRGTAKSNFLTCEVCGTERSVEAPARLLSPTKSSRAQGATSTEAAACLLDTAFDDIPGAASPTPSQSSTPAPAPAPPAVSASDAPSLAKSESDDDASLEDFLDSII